tara:strand:- start:37 stop:1089 length:1053 start_codon:yes stop_codon:yes gene_type:complete
MIIIIFSDIIWNLNTITLRAEKKPFPFIVLNLTNVISILILTIHFVNNNSMGIEGVLYANVLGSLLTLGLSLVLLVKRFSFNAIDLSIVSPILKFGIPFLPAAIFAMIIESSDRFILAYLMNDHYVGIYSATYKLGVFGLLLVMAFNMGWTPFFLQHGKEKNAHKDFATIQTFFLGIMGFLGILLTIVIPQIIHWDFMGYRLIGVSFVDGLFILPIILMSYYFFGLYVLLLPKIYILEKTYIIPIVRGIGALSNILLNFTLIPIWGILGAALASLGAYILMFISMFWITNKLQPTTYNTWGWFFPIFMWLIVIFVQNNILFISVLTIYPIVWYTLVLNTFEKEKIKEFFV